MGEDKPYDFADETLRQQGKLKPGEAFDPLLVTLREQRAAREAKAKLTKQEQPTSK